MYFLTLEKLFGTHITMMHTLLLMFVKIISFSKNIVWESDK
jgi:hypothetical protein